MFSANNRPNALLRTAHQDLFTAFYQVFAAIGFAPDWKQLDNIRAKTDKLAGVMHKQIQNDTVEILRKLQVAVDKAFKATFKEVVALEARIKELEAMGHKQGDMSQFHDKLDKLERQANGDCSCGTGAGEDSSAVSKS